MPQAVQNYEDSVKIPVDIKMAQWHAMSMEAEKIAADLVITDEVEEECAISSLSKVKQFSKEVEAAESTSKAPFQEYVARIKNMFLPIRTSLTKAEGIIKEKLLVRNKEKERLVQEERKRLEAERQKQIEDAKQKAELEGRDATANELAFLEKPEPPAPTKTTKAVGGASSTIRKTWKARIVDPMAVVVGIAQGRIPIGVVEFKMTWFNEQARAIKKAQTADGVEFFEEETIAAK